MIQSEEAFARAPPPTCRRDRPRRTSVCHLCAAIDRRWMRPQRNRPSPTPLHPLVTTAPPPHLTATNRENSTRLPLPPRRYRPANSLPLADPAGRALGAASSIPFSRGTVRELTAAVAQEGRRADGRRGPPPPAVADLRRLLVPRVDRWSSPQEDLCCGHAAPRRATPLASECGVAPHARPRARAWTESLAPASNGVDCSGKHQG